MVKTITKIGNSQGIILDSALLQMARLKVGDQVNVELHQGGTLTVTPLSEMPPKEEVSSLIDETLEKYSTTMQNLA